MKIKEVIDRLSEWSKEPLMPEEQVLKLINKLEKRILNDDLAMREANITYIEHTDINEDCIVPDEYADMYVFYVLSEVYAKRYETERAALHTSQFNNLYNSYASYVIRTYDPKPCAKITL